MIFGYVITNSANILAHRLHAELARIWLAGNRPQVAR
jgi:hypothetical protein